MSVPPTSVGSGAGPDRGASSCEDLPFELDALRGDLYRMLDELARAAPGERDALVDAFEHLWTRFKDVNARRG
jgi:hypothetical protein